MTTVTPAYHMEAYGVDDNRYDMSMYSGITCSSYSNVSHVVFLSITSSLRVLYFEKSRYQNNDLGTKLQLRQYQK